MVRKWSCLLLSLGMLLSGAGEARAAAEYVPFFCNVSGANTWEVIRQPAMETGEAPPKTADRPAPIIGAMGMAFSVAALMVFADQKKK